MEESGCVIRSSLRDFLIYLHSPVLSAHVFFLRKSFPRDVCLDVIRYIMTLFCSRLLTSVESAII